MGDENHQMQSELQVALVNFDGMKINALIEQGADIAHTYVDAAKYRNALHELVLNYIAYSLAERPPKLHIKFIDILQVFIAHGLDINEPDIKHMTALHHVATSPDHPEIIRVLIASGARVNQPDAGQQTALHKAVLTGSKDDVSTLLDGGADPNIMDNMGQSPIHVAVKRRSNQEIVTLLLGCGGKVNLNHPEWSKSSRGSTPLHTAAHYGRTENGKVLLSLGAEPNVTNGAGETALHTAASHEISGRLCSLLLKQGAKVDTCDLISGETPLHKAIRANIEENVHVLVRHRADRNLADNSGNTALHKAARYCQDIAIWRLLLTRGFKLNVLNNENQTPFDYAIKYKNSTALFLLRALQQTEQEL